MTKQEKRDAALKAYNAIKIPALKDYEAIQAAALKAFKAIEVPAWEAWRAELKRINNEPDNEFIEVDGKRYQLVK